MATRRGFFGENGSFFPGEDENPEPTSGPGGGAIPPGYDDPLGPSPQARDRALVPPIPIPTRPSPTIPPPQPYGAPGPLPAFMGGPPGARPRPGQGQGPGGFLGFPGAPDADAASLDDYLARQRGTTIQALQTMNLLGDANYLAAVETEAQRRMADTNTYGVNALNPIQRSLMRQRVLADPEFSRRYMISTHGYDPRTGHMVRPAGFDPMADEGFLTASYQRGDQRNAMAASVWESLYGPRSRELGQQAQQPPPLPPPPSFEPPF